MLCGLCGWRSVRLALLATPDSAVYHFRLWQAQADERGSLPQELDRALTLNPRYGEAWIARGLLAEAVGEREKAEASLLQAAAIDHLYLPSWTLANFYVRAGDMPQFWIWTRRAAGMSNGAAALFQLCWRASGDGREILERGIPDAPPVRRAYLDFLVNSKRLDAAGPVADQISGSAKRADIDLLLRYCDALLAGKQADPARRIWNALAAQRIIPYSALDPGRGSSLTNGEFSGAPLQRGFDWRWKAAEGVAISFDTNSGEVEISLSGKQAESLEMVEQYVPVLANRKYLFRYRCRTRDLAADTGTGWSFVDARTGIEAGGGHVAASADDWREQTLTFSTPEGCGLVRILLRYQRPAGRMRAEGSARFSRLSLAFL
jgi:tetratricopeptide (TPR) repeat protein